MTMLSDGFVPWSGARLSCKFVEKVIERNIVDQLHSKPSLESALESVRSGFISASS